MTQAACGVLAGMTLAGQVFLWGCAGGIGADPAASGVQRLPVIPLGGAFTLTDHDGKSFELASMHGQVVLIFFGYTFCPDVCPTTLSKLSGVVRDLGKDGARVKVLYITVDPARDTPAVMKAHLSHFGLDALGLTGDPSQIATVAKQYGAAYEVEQAPGSAASYTVSHSTWLYALDTQGRLRTMFPYEASVKEVADGVRTVLAQPLDSVNGDGHICRPGSPGHPGGGA